MLEVVKITNLALISNTVVNFKEGFNVLTGETGAGKSLIIDALLFLTGIRADKTLIKSGEDFARVEGVFSVDNNNDNINNILSTINLENEGTIIISRYFSLNGKNECRINGELVTLNILRKISNELLDIFGQNDSQVLLNSDNHLGLLDSVYFDKLEGNKKTLNLKLTELHSINNEIKLLGGLDKDRDNNIDLLKYQIDEIENASLYVGEEEELKNKITLMQNMEKIYNYLSQASEALSGEYSITNSIKSAINNLSTIDEYDNDIYSQKDRLVSIRYELEDVIMELSSKLSGLNYSEEDFDKVQDRLSDIKDLERKYGNTIEDILHKKEEMVLSLDKLLNSSEEIERLRLNKNKLLKEIYNDCIKLRTIRKECSKDFCDRLTLKLKELGMKSANVEVSFTNDFDENNIENIVNENGGDNIEFLFSANLGVEPRPISKIISGGEMSRFMLAFKTLTNNSKKTCVFDEIDTGIGGEVGGIVGKKICEISTNTQVICITHLAQIASYGDSNYLIKKYEKDNNTITEVNLLDSDSKVIEIARMLGNSEKLTSIEHAKEMIKDSIEYKDYLKAI